MLATLDMRIIESMHTSVFTVAGPLPFFTWSKTRMDSSRSDPTFTIISRATTCSTNSMRNIALAAEGNGRWEEEGDSRFGGMRGTQVRRDAPTRAGAKNSVGPTCRRQTLV
jgi:hypothetical protein